MPFSLSSGERAGVRGRQRDIFPNSQLQPGRPKDARQPRRLPHYEFHPMCASNSSVQFDPKFPATAAPRPAFLSRFFSAS